MDFQLIWYQFKDNIFLENGVSKYSVNVASFFLVDHNVYNDTLIQACTGNPQFFYRSRFWEKIPFTDGPQNAQSRKANCKWSKIISAVSFGDVLHSKQKPILCKFSSDDNLQIRGVTVVAYYC